ncbi:hypothetical protein V6N11_065345 [Hibiscus sabdariffa]|uniref:Uncharacterized protein n=1 Tax=Hibiscus sabdariffa TaxID=183260 RepID=A0ABR2QGN3_9ROSI
MRKSNGEDSSGFTVAIFARSGFPTKPPQAGGFLFASLDVVWGFDFLNGLGIVSGFSLLETQTKSSFVSLLGCDPWIVTSFVDV